MNQQRIINTALDCISRFKTSKQPLKNVASDVITQRKLNSSERKCLLDIVFSWARQSFLVKDFLKDYLRFFAGISEQQKELITIQLLAASLFGFLETMPEIHDMKERYEAFLASLGDKRYLLSLGSLFSEELQKTFGEEAITVAKGLFTSPKKYLAFDQNALSLSELTAALNAEGLSVSPHAIATTALALTGDLQLEKLALPLRQNLWFMDAGSQIIAALIKPKAHERVLDMCAGEGGKARYITMNPCTYVAMDINGGRLKQARKRLINKTVQFLEGDATKTSFAEGFDWILLDAPCSGSGTLRRHPDLIYRLKKSDLEYYQTLQRDLLQKAAQLLKPNGKLVYATCSLFASENKHQIDRLLSSNNKLIGLQIGALLVDGQINLSAKAHNSNSLELIPHIHDCDGFFVAVITKSGE